MLRSSSKALYFSACTLLLTAFSGQALAYLEDNLLIRYDFNKGRGAAVSDQTGLGYDAVLHGDATFINNDPWAENTGNAKFGNAITLDGAGDYLRIESDFHNERLNPGTLAIAAWIRPTATGSGKQYIVSKVSHATRTGYALAIDDATGYLHAEFYLRDDTFIREVVSSRAIPDSTWTHIVASFDGSSIALYVNGEFSNSTDAIGSIATSSADFTIGALSTAVPSDGFKGAIDELRLYSAISAADIAALANAEYGEPELILYESFDTISRILADSGTTGARFQHLDNSDLVEGVFDRGLRFQDALQTNERLSWPVRNNLDSKKGHITLWFRPDWSGNSNGSNSILETDNKGLAGEKSGDGIRVYRFLSAQNNKEFRFLARNNYARSVKQEPGGITSWVANDWHYLELIWDLTHETPYLAYVIDGELAELNDTAYEPASGSPANLFLGANSNYNGMAGTVDELKIYSRPQYDVFDNAEKIAALMAANRADGHKQEYETVYNSADASFPDASLMEKNPVTFFQAPPFAPVYAGDVPSAENVADTLHYSAAKNDTESLFFGIYSQIDADDVRITVSDLRDSSGTSIVAATDLKLTVVKKWWQTDESRPRQFGFFPVFVPELLMYDDRYNFRYDDYDQGAEATHRWNDLPDFPIPASASVETELKAYTSKQFVLNVSIPAATAPGSYTATATVTGSGIYGSRVLTLSINVPDITLPKADKDFIIYHRAQYLGSQNDYDFRDFVSSRSDYVAELQDIIAHGFNGIHAYGNDPGYVADIAAAGFDGMVIFPDTSANTVMVEAMNEAFGGAWFYGSDEPDTNRQLEWQMSRSAAVHAIGGKTTTAIYLPWADCLSSPHRLYPDSQNGGVLVDYCPYTGGEIFDPDEYLDMENLNSYSLSGNTQAYFRDLLSGVVKKDSAKQSYYWQARAVDPRVNRYMAGFHLYLTDLDGVWPYVYLHNNAGDPFDDLDAFDESGDFFPDQGVVYPTRQGPMSTIAWEAMREGIDDYRYLQLWRSLHDAMIAEDPGEAARSRERIELNENGMGLNLFRHQLAGALNLSYADYAATRELIATEILVLQTGLADPDADNLSNAAERLLGTDPYDDDTDNDWFRDGIEVNILGTDPLDPDSDNDGTDDFSELFQRAVARDAAIQP